MAKKWDTSKRYSTGSDWVRASLESAGIDAERLGSERLFKRYCDLVGSTCKRSKGIWTRLKRPPRDDRGLVWHAFKIGMHYAEWGDYAPWGDAVTNRILDASDQARDDFKFVVHSTVLFNKLRREA